MIAVGWGVLAWLVPLYAKNDLGVSARLIGLLLLANDAVTVVVAQVPIVKLVEGRRRVVMLALASSIWVVACLLVVSPAGVLRIVDRGCETSDARVETLRRGGPRPGTFASRMLDPVAARV